jgi:hypothetical protein
VICLEEKRIAINLLLNKKLKIERFRTLKTFLETKGGSADLKNERLGIAKILG